MAGCWHSASAHGTATLVEPWRNLFVTRTLPKNPCVVTSAPPAVVANGAAPFASGADAARSVLGKADSSRGNARETPTPRRN
jgi:hypothetical protein